MAATTKSSIASLTLGLLAGLAGTPRAARGERLAPLDVVIEQMAEHIVFHQAVEESEKTFLAANGYSAGPWIKGKNAFVLRVFLSTRPDRPSVVAFRGSVFREMKTIMSDLDPKGVGVTKFKVNRGLIEQTLAEAARRGPVIAAGHSLGAAFAQIAACEYPSLISRVVTFHAPGIERSEAEKLERHNRANTKAAIKSDHYQCEGDIVSEVGEALTEGLIHEYKVEGSVLDLAAKHTTYLLADEERTRGQLPPPVSDKGRRVVHLGDRSSATKKTTSLEALRVEVGKATVAAKKVSSSVDKAEDSVEDSLKKKK